MPARVLIVEPVRWLRELEAEACARAGYDVERAGSVRAALEAAVQQLPDVVVARAELPDGRVADLARGLARLGLVILVGIAGRDASERALREAGAREVIRQPHGRAPLVAALARALGAAA